MDELLIKNKLDELESKLDDVSRFAQQTRDEPVREVNRPYQRMVDSAKKFDELSKELGKTLCSEVERDGESEEFFWRNELWNHSDFTVSEPMQTMLETVYRFPFAYELDGAYDEREKVDMAQFALSETRRKKEDISELRGLL